MKVNDTIEIDGVSDIEYLDSGQRGVIYTGMYQGIKIIIKAENPESMAIGRIINEANWLRKLNKKGIGPKLIASTDNYLIERFVDGPIMVKHMKDCSKKQAISIIKDVFNQCFTMDRLGINKEEMHRPIKHIIIEDSKPVMLDFERTRNTTKPKNVTQFCQFLAWSDMTDVLKEKGIVIDKDDIQKKAMEYKKDISEKNLNKIFLSFEI